MLIDWLTLRTKIDHIQESDLLLLIPYLAKMEVTSFYNDEVIKTKLVVDIDAVRSDFVGMVWNITSNGKDKYLNIGASPATIEHGSNLFGSGDYHHCKQVLIDYARKRFSSVLLFGSGWHPRRIDITQNYFLESHNQVKEALHILRASDGMRQKSTVKGDSVYFGETSRYRRGKIYDKLIQAIDLCKRAVKLNRQPPYSESQLHIMDSILRLELTLGRQWFDEHQDESILNQAFLVQQHEGFFSQFIGDADVTDMDTLLKNLLLTAPSSGIARSAYSTYLLIKQNGFEHTKQSMTDRTFHRHKKALLNAGLCMADLTSAKIVELRRRKIMMQPVYNWQQLQEFHRLAA